MSLHPYRTPGNLAHVSPRKLPRVVAATALTRLVRVSYDVFVLEEFKETTHTDLLGNTTTFCRWQTDITYNRVPPEDKHGTFSMGRHENDRERAQTWVVFDALDQQLHGAIEP